MSEKFGGYYLNGLEAVRSRLIAALRIGAHRAEVLHRIGSSCTADHDAVMAVKRKMLAVVEEALSETCALQMHDRASFSETGNNFPPSGKTFPPEQKGEA